MGTEPDLPVPVRVVLAGNAGPLTLDGSRTYLLGREPCLVIDPGPALADHLDAVEAAIGAPGSVLIALTHAHPDHAAAAPELAVRIGARIAATPETSERAGFGPPDLPLAAGAALRFDGGGLTVVSAPGHSPDHVCFHWPEGRALFAGDVMLGSGTSMVAPPEGDMAAYMGTLERLARLDLAVIYPGHGPPITDPPTRIEEYLRHRREREAQVLNALTAGARTVPEIRARVYPDLDPALRPAAEGSVRAHLDKLAREGRIPPDDAGRIPHV